MNFEKESLKKFSFLQFLPMWELILKRHIAIIFLIIDYFRINNTLRIFFENSIVVKEYESKAK